jgi:hypothetical protein
LRTTAAAKRTHASRGGVWFRPQRGRYHFDELRCGRWFAETERMMSQHAARAAAGQVVIVLPAANDARLGDVLGTAQPGKAGSSMRRRTSTVSSSSIHSASIWCCNLGAEGQRHQRRLNARRDCPCPSSHREKRPASTVRPPHIGGVRLHQIAPPTAPRTRRTRASENARNPEKPGPLALVCISLHPCCSASTNDKLSRRAGRDL